MWEKSRTAPLVNTPTTLSAALNLLSRTPGIGIWAGGTAQDTLQSPQLLSITSLEELKRLTPWEKFADWGAGLTLNQMIQAGKNQIPQILEEAVGKIGTYVVRNQATLGGNLCTNQAGDLYPVLQLLGSHAEFRTAKGFRWLPAHQWSLIHGLEPQPGELLTRLRIPKESWNIVLYEKMGGWNSKEEERLSYMALVRTSRESVSSLRMGIFLPRTGLIRSRSLESLLQGRKLPLSSADRDRVHKAMEEELPFLGKPLTPFRLARVKSVTDWMVRQLREE